MYISSYLSSSFYPEFSSSLNYQLLSPFIRLLVPLNTDPTIAHGALKLIVAVCSKPGTLNPVSILLTQNSQVAEELMQSFVERLETDEPESASMFYLVTFRTDASISLFLL